jgi:hypothetical protein
MEVFFMDKKELILTVAKDLMIAYKLTPENKDRIKPENATDALGRLLSLMVDQVELVYHKIKD